MEVVNISFIFPQLICHLGQDENNVSIENFQNLPPPKNIQVKQPKGRPSKDPFQQGENSEEMGADESTLQLSGQESEAEHSIENPLSSESHGDESEPASKKKRKIHNYKAIVEDNQAKVSKALKLKKSKSESKSKTPL